MLDIFFFIYLLFHFLNVVAYLMVHAKTFSPFPRFSSLHFPIVRPFLGLWHAAFLS